MVKKCVKFEKADNILSQNCSEKLSYIVKKKIVVQKKSLSKNNQRRVMNKSYMNFDRCT